MTTQYRFACECGREELVTPQDAGQLRSCTCGRNNEIPTLRQLRNLPLAAHDKRSSMASGRWTRARGMWFNVGAIIFLLSLVSGGYTGFLRYRLHTEQPELQWEQHFERVIRTQNVTQLWEGWTHMREHPLGERPTPGYLMARQLASRYHIILMVAVLAGFLGLAISLAAVSFRR